MPYYSQICEQSKMAGDFPKNFFRENKILQTKFFENREKRKNFENRPFFNISDIFIFRFSPNFFKPGTGKRVLLSLPTLLFFGEISR